MPDTSIIMLIVWAVVFVAALLAEIFTEALVSVWFCIGALVAGGISFIPGMPFWGSIIVFVGVSALSFLIIRPMVKNKLFRLHSSTNVDSVIGRKCVVTKKITTFEKGEVKLDGVLWSAIKKEADDDIDEGKIVEVISIQGNKLFVKEVHS